MPEKEFGSLKERLLRGGVAPRQVERLLLELKTHAAALLDPRVRFASTLRFCGLNPRVVQSGRALRTRLPQA